jgi:hypothetical protein
LYLTGNIFLQKETDLVDTTYDHGWLEQFPNKSSRSAERELSLLFHQVEV